MTDDIYRAFEGVVGSENVSRSHAIMSTYFRTEFSAIVLPKDTAEVQAVVRLCNRHGLKFRAISTGWTGRFLPGTVLLDLRRMNRIIEINEQNMYAVVEPYVIAAQLQAELFKRGLHFSVKGAGSNTSAMLRGHGHLDQSTGADDRNHLAVEWVTPEGDVVRSGSLGSVDEWFSGDGPGPSIRAILTTAIPTSCTPGVFTKAAVKLYHWPGPTAFDVEGTSPRYTLGEHPPYMMARYLSFPSIEQMWDAELKIGESEIALEVMGFNTSMVAANITTSIEEDDAMYQRLNKDVLGPGFFVIIAGISAGDFAYKKKVLETIVAEAAGESLKAVEEPEIEGMLLMHCTRISASIRETFRPGGAFRSVPIMGQRDLNINWAIGAGKAKLPLIEKGLIVDDGGGFFGWGVEQGHLGKTEIFCKFNPVNPEALDAVAGWAAEQWGRALGEGYFGNTMADDETLHTKVGPALSDFHVWWERFLEEFDPNGVVPNGGRFGM